MKELDAFFKSEVEVPRMKVVKRQTLDTLINEESLLLAKYIRDETDNWIPRMVTL